MFIMPELRPSGAEVMFQKAAPIWLSQGFRLTILTTGKSTGSFAKTLGDSGYDIIHSRLDRIPSPQQIIRFTKRIVKLKPDIAHFNAEAHGPLHTLPALLCNARIFRTVHSSFEFVGQLRFRRLVSRRVSRLLGCRFIAISNAVCLNEKSRFHNPSEVCSNWFDDSYFRPPSPAERTTARATLKIPSDQFAIVSIGNSSLVKNYSSIISSLAICQNQSAHYYQVGAPDPTGGENRLASQLRLEDKVHLVGHSDDVRSWLWAADVFIMPSIYEGFGLAAAEALACATPCILSDISGFADFKQAGAVAEWVKPTPGEIARGIDTLTKSTGSLNLALIASSQRIRQNFSLEIGCRRYSDAWRSQTAATNQPS